MSHNYKMARRDSLKGRRSSRFGRRDTLPDDGGGGDDGDGACEFYVGMTISVTRPTFAPVDGANPNHVAVANKINSLPNPLVWTVTEIINDGMGAIARVTGHDRDVDGGVNVLYTTAAGLTRDESGDVPTVTIDSGYPAIWAFPLSGYDSGLVLTVGPVPITSCGVPFNTTWFVSNTEVAVTTTDLNCTVTLD